MKNLSFAAFKLYLLLIVVFSAFALKARGQASTVEPVRKPVLVELFTSEGCSSCPPADVLLQKLEAQQPVAGAEIIALEEHVDYWDHDGWVDPYSSPEWTQRQQAYVTLTKKDVYTPEFVVDGQSQFVGNNPHQAVVEIEKAARGVKAAVTITAETPDANGSQRFNVSVGKLEGNISGDVAEVWLAITEDGLHSSVNRGENAGHILQHVSTLRSLHRIGIADASGTAVSFAAAPLVKFNSHWSADNLRVTVFVQKKKSRAIVGAASVRIKGEAKAERAAS